MSLLTVSSCASELGQSIVKKIDASLSERFCLSILPPTINNNNIDVDVYLVCEDCPDDISNRIANNCSQSLIIINTTNYDLKLPSYIPVLYQKPEQLMKLDGKTAYDGTNDLSLLLIQQRRKRQLESAQLWQKLGYPFYGLKTLFVVKDAWMQSALNPSFVYKDSHGGIRAFLAWILNQLQLIKDHPDPKTWVKFGVKVQLLDFQFAEIIADLLLDLHDQHPEEFGGLAKEFIQGLYGQNARFSRDGWTRRWFHLTWEIQSRSVNPTLVEVASPQTLIPFYVLNLDSRPDHWQNVTRSLIRSHSWLSVHRVNTLDGRKMMDQGDVRFDKARLKFTAKISPGAIGCAGGHDMVWRALKETDSDFGVYGAKSKEILSRSVSDSEKEYEQGPIIVGEPDAAVGSTASHDCDALIRALSKNKVLADVDIIWIGYHMEPVSRLKAMHDLRVRTIREGIPPHNIGGTFCYMIPTPKARLRLAQLLESASGISVGIDTWMLHHPKIKHAYMDPPCFFSQYWIPNDPSTHDSDCGPQWRPALYSN
jgi:hypothetical protein